MIGDGLVLVDKPAGPTSHDIVAQMRRVFGTRKVGHAGTLDPMATGMLVVGIGRATRLLGHLAGSDKEYLATIRLGQATSTDDAQGQPLGGADASGFSDTEILEAVAAFRGPLQQRPSSVSAVKVNGQRAYARVRAGQEVHLEPRQVVVHELEVVDISRHAAAVDVQVRVVCSAGTYVRALARDIGARLGVGGHLTRLRRTRSGRFTQMRTPADIAQVPDLIPLDQVVPMVFPVVHLPADLATRARHGVRVAAPIGSPSGLVGVLDDAGHVISLCQAIDGILVPEAVLVGE